MVSFISEFVMFLRLDLMNILNVLELLELFFMLRMIMEVDCLRYLLKWENIFKIFRMELLIIRNKYFESSYDCFILLNEVRDSFFF